MSRESYERALHAAVREYEKAIADRAALDTRIANLQHTIGTLNKLCGYEPTVPLGLTDACRMVLRSSGQSLTALEVRERLRAFGFDLEKYANALAAIHTVLKRLNEAGEIRLVPKPSGKHAYLWQTPPTAVAIGPEIAQFIRQSGTFHTDLPNKPRRRKK